ncbi:MAG: tRNA (N(6)-L-threonylcarbamoyladenosine(37)-C(2))-methylthiotransferase MtaB [Planctomycetes bacterium]|nr:tRNA (N(6)-L-threonylcarbamoyladenosine(37)-C(2))-methylthiotransferase MtaB [Planctomycetota bacterium]
MSRPRRVSITTLGCRLNQAETALIAARFRERGYVIAAPGEAVDVAVVHTCSVTGRADARCRQEIRKARRAGPGAVVCAVGCLAQSEPGEVAALGGVDLVVGNERKYELVDLVEGRAGRGAPEVHVSRRPDGFAAPYPLAGYYPRTTRAHVKVQDGCDFGCAFCLLPRVRGRARSRRLDAILAEARELVRQGHRELVVTGVNIGTYRFEDRRLADIARALEAIDGVARIRISSIEPTTIDAALLEWMATSPRACRHLHVPLQSGDDAILAAMHRVYTAAEFGEFVRRARALMPDLGFGTDVIVGFPGETEASHRRTRTLLEALPLTYLHVFSHSARRQTAAAALPGAVDRATVKARSAELRAWGAARKRAVHEAAVGEEVEVLLETVDADGWRKGRTRNYLRVAVDAAASRENTLVRVRIEKAENDHCVGSIIGG